MTSLSRTLDYRDVLLLVVCSVIGSGIFLVPGDILKLMHGSVLLALLVWVAGGVLSLLGALTYGEMAAMKPEAGGLYVYIRDTFGALLAFLYGWTMFALIATGAVATLAAAFGKYLGQIVSLTPLAARLASVGMILVVVAINVRGTRQSADVQNVSTLLKAGAIVVMSAALMLFGREYSATADALLPPPGRDSLWGGFALALVAALWAYEAWQYATFSAGEVREPQRNFPRAFLGGMLVLIGIYFLANFAYVVSLGPEKMAGSQTIAADAVGEVLHPALAKMIAAAILISAFSAANAVLLTAPRIFYAMAGDGVFFKKLAEIHPRFGTPALSVLLSGTWAVVLTLNATFQELYRYVVVASWVFYALGGVSIFLYRRREPGAPRPYRVPGYPWTPLLFVLASVAVVVSSVHSLDKDWKFAAVCSIMAAGIPAFFVWRWNGKKARN